MVESGDRVAERNGLRGMARHVAAAVIMALLVPGLAFSTVPPVHKPTDLSKWLTSPKVAPPHDYVQYSQCQVQNKMPGKAAAQYCDPPSSPSSSTPPTYWSAYYTMEFVWKAKTYRYEVTVPFSSWPDRPTSSRLLVDKVQVEISGPTDHPLLLKVGVYSGTGARPLDQCCVLWRHNPAYTLKNHGNSMLVSDDSRSEAYGTFWWGRSSDEASNSPVVSFELPIVTQNVDRLPMSDGTCYTYNWEKYPCTGYITIKPV